MMGPLLGGRFSRHCKRHPGLIPLIGFISVGLGSAVLYLARLALYSPDVSFWQFPRTTRASRRSVPASEHHGDPHPLPHSTHGSTCSPAPPNPQ
ncbi:NADH dehydrogenase [ubiquinone] 1 alpha subcomplex subunit 4-like 2 isoform X2 [Columba livia]|uniref:NADH dehydrogenase [ubiquinone] 1 alpha subcomplex subunit 4-like 2 isoform X2 n=1 Tax=Columba livia TaxID=8932 RepID=UPI0031B9E6CA